MKKLLLASLLVVGATSFGAVSTELSQQGAGEAKLPIKVVGNVISTTNTTLVVTPLNNAGVNGASMEFAFGDLVTGRDQTLSGNFEVALYKEDAKVAFTNAPTVTLEGGTPGSGENIKTTTLDQAKLTYTLGALTKKGIAYENSIDISVKPTAAGNFVDNAVSVKVAVTGQSMN